MTREDLEEIVKIVEKNVVRARSLGGFSTEAESLLIVWEVLLKVTRHLHESAPRKRNDPDRKTDPKA